MTGTADKETERTETAAAISAFRRGVCAECGSANVYSTEGVDVGPNHTWLYGCDDCGWRYFLMAKWLRLRVV